MAMESKRYKVTFKLKNNNVILDPRSNFDSLLGWSAYDLAGENCDETLIHNLPLKKVLYEDKYFYSSSLPIIEGFQKHVEFGIAKSLNYSRFSQLFDNEITINLLKRRYLEGSRGAWKMRTFHYTVCVADAVSFVADVTDYNYFEKLIFNIKAIGKKRSIGFGAVSDIDIFETDEPIQRYVPVDLCKKITYPCIFTRITPPYWEKGGAVLCCLSEI